MWVASQSHCNIGERVRAAGKRYGPRCAAP